MVLENNDKFLTTLSNFQSKQEKSKQWISVTIKRDRPPSMKKQLSKKLQKQAIEEIKQNADPAELYSLKYKAKFGGDHSSTEVVAGKAISECNQLVNVFRLHFFSQQRIAKTKVIKKEASKPNSKSQNAKRRQERHKRNLERRKKRTEIKVLQKKKKQQGLNLPKSPSKHESKIEEEKSV